MRVEKHTLIRFAWVAAIFCAAYVPAARADYAVLQSGQRVHITGYEYVTQNLSRRCLSIGISIELPIR